MLLTVHPHCPQSLENTPKLSATEPHVLPDSLEVQLLLVQLECPGPEGLSENNQHTELPELPHGTTTSAHLSAPGAFQSLPGSGTGLAGGC